MSDIGDICEMIKLTLTSPNCLNRNLEPVNIVDGLYRVADALYKISEAINNTSTGE